MRRGLSITDTRLNGVGSAADPTAAEMQRPVDGKTCWGEPIPAIFHRHERIRPCPFGVSTLVAFRKRFSEKDLKAILEASVPKTEAEGKDDPDDGNEPPSSGTLVLDATCCPADIAYPQDIDLLDQAREKAEETVDELCKQTGQKKPRMYRRSARKNYLRLSKSKKRSTKAIHSALRKQLQYLRRDIGYVAELVQKGAKLSSKQADRLNVVTTVHKQQRIMFESGSHSIPHRIVSLSQPWVRPIVRGKAHVNTEFGAKLHISLVNGYVRIERLDFATLNESEDFWRAAARYRECYGCYPQRILADKIYRNRQTLAFCKEHGIRLSGPTLGKPPKDPSLSRQAKNQEYQDSCDRQHCGGCFWNGQDRLWSRPRYGTSAGNDFLCDWHHTSSPEHHQVAERCFCLALYFPSGPYFP